MALGPTLGGFLASWFGLRWIFFADVPFCLALALAVPRLAAETDDREGRRLDPVGLALLTIALGLTIDALLRGDGSPGSDLPRWRCDGNPAGSPRCSPPLQFGYWALLVDLPPFPGTGLQMSMEVAGAALLSATLPMLLVPLIGGRLATHWLLPRQRGHGLGRDDDHAPGWLRH